MPIKGLTDRAAQFPEIGRIRKGAPKEEFKPGHDLDHFRVVFDESEEATQRLFEASYPAKPRSLNVWLPFARLEDCWDAWIEAYLASGLIYRSDGERVAFWIDPETGVRRVKDGVPLVDGDWVVQDPATGQNYVPCLAARDLPIGFYVTGKGKRLPVQAKPIGRLKVIIPELKRFGFLTFVTTSEYDIGNLSAQLRALADIQERAGLPGVSGIPMKLRRKLTRCMRRMPDGTRQLGESWLVSIEADTTWAQAKAMAMLDAATPDLIEGKFLELPEPSEEDEGGTDDYDGNGHGDPAAQEHPEVDDEMRQVPEGRKAPPKPAPAKPSAPAKPTTPDAPPPAERQFDLALLDELVKEGLAPDRPEAAAMLGHSPWRYKVAPMKKASLKAWCRGYNRGIDEGLEPDAAAGAASEEIKELEGGG